jgi:hypothetical protein
MAVLTIKVMQMERLHNGTLLSDKQYYMVIGTHILLDSTAIDEQYHLPKEIRNARIYEHYVPVIFNGWRSAGVMDYMLVDDPAVQGTAHHAFLSAMPCTCAGCHLARGRRGSKGTL